jgi:hypothetical protein
MYTGNNKVYPNFPTVTNVVHVYEPLFDKGCTLYLDNWYTSPEVCERVMKRKTDVVGIVRPNRHDMPPDTTTTKLKNRGEFATWSSRKSLAVKWRVTKMSICLPETCTTKPKASLEEKEVRLQEKR